MHKYVEKWWSFWKVEGFVSGSADLRLWGLGFSCTLAVRHGPALDVNFHVGPLSIGFGIMRRYERGNFDDLFTIEE